MLHNKGARSKADKKEQHLRLVEPHEEDELADVYDIPIKRIPFERYAFAFENIVFESGGCRALAYCGVVRVLEECGIWVKIRRLCGAGTGALTAALLTVGYNSYQLEKSLNQDWHAWLNEHSCGYCCLGSNLTKYLGWNDGEHFERWVGNKMKEATGKVNITFREVYHIFGKELCIVVSNLSQGEVEYCHVKTTPDMPIATAVRVSLSQPGLNQPRRYMRHGREDVMMDGSLVCAYPIHAFDGWWLSLHPDNNFLQKLNPLKHAGRMLDRDERFGQHNDSTIGVMLYSDGEQDIYSSMLQQRDKMHQSAPLPATRLQQSNEDKDVKRHVASEKYTRLSVALDYFMEALREHGLDKKTSLTKKEFQDLISKKSCLTKSDLEALFGDKQNADTIFRQIQPAKENQVTLQELVGYFDRRGLKIKTQYSLQRQRQVKKVEDLFSNLVLTTSANSKQGNVIKSDVERTIGVNCHHVTPADSALEVDDKIFLIEQGKRATYAFLHHFVTKRTVPLPLIWEGEDSMRSFRRDDLAVYIDEDLSEIIDIHDYSEDYTEV